MAEETEVKETSEKIEEVKVKPLRSIAEIELDLNKPISRKHLSTRKQGGKELTYISWFHAVRYLTYYTDGRWSYEIISVHNDDKYCIVKVRITIQASDGTFSREATGIEELSLSGYGDYVSNASGMALRRAAATWGLGLHLYSDKG